MILWCDFTETRRAGFAGQHLVVGPKPGRDEAMRHPLLRALLVTDAGYFSQAHGHHVEREKGVPAHLLIA